MTDYAKTLMEDRIKQLERSAAQCRDLADEHRADAAQQEERAALALRHADELRAAIAKLQTDAQQWTKDDLARFHAEGHAALEPNTLVPHPGVDAIKLLGHNDRSRALYRALLGDQPDGENRAAAVDVRAFQPDGDTYGRDFVEPHLG